MAGTTTRLIALGSPPLMEGFALIGFETHPNATAATVETVLESLVRQGARARVLLEQDLARGEGPWLARVRNEGGHIVVTEIPALNQPHTYRPLVEDHVARLLGPGSLD